MMDPLAHLDVLDWVTSGDWECLESGNDLQGRQLINRKGFGGQI